MHVLGHFAALEAGSTHIDAFGLAVNQSAYTLKVGIKPTLGNIMGMGNVISKQGSLAADFAYFCHTKPQFLKRRSQRIYGESRKRQGFS